MLLIALALFSLSGGVALSQPSLFTVALVLFVYLALSLVFSPPQGRGSSSQIEVRRTLENKRIYEGESFKTALEIYNPGPAKIEVIELYDLIPQELSIESGSNDIALTLLPREKKSFSYSGKSLAQGEFILGPTRARIEDYTNSKAELIVFETESTLTVLPKITYLPKLAIRPRITRNWPGEIISKKRGQGLEFYGISEYIEGDPLKRINWKVSSKFSEERLQSNQFLSELGGDSIVLLDARQQAAVGKYPRSSLDYSIQAAALISYRLLRDRNRVGMVIVGAALTKIFPGFGKRQFDRLLLALSMTKPSGEWKIGSIGKYLTLFFSRAVQIVFVSSLADADSFLAVDSLVSRGYSVLVVSPSALDAEKMALKENGLEMDPLSYKLASLERRNRIEHLKQIARVIDWNLEVSLNEAISTNLLMRRARVPNARNT